MPAKQTVEARLFRSAGSSMPPGTMLEYAVSSKTCGQYCYVRPTEDFLRGLSGEGYTAWSCVNSSRDGGCRPGIRAYRQYRVRYVVGLVLPDSAARWYYFDFATPEFGKFHRDELHPSADLVHRLAASALAGWIERRKSFFYVRACSSRYSTLYRLGAETAARGRVDLELEALAARHQPS